MRPVSESTLFCLLPKWQVPWSELVLSYGAQALVVAIFVWIPVLHPEVLEGAKRDYHAVELVPTPVPIDHEAQRQLPKPVMAARLDPAPDALRLAVPEARPKVKTEEPPAPEVKIASRKPDVLPAAKAPVVPKQAIRTNVFSSGSSAPQTIVRAPEHVQTGGFGDPNGVPARTTQTQAVNIAQLGGFDMPSGPGYGNGSGGARGTRGVVASTGFGNGVAIAENRASQRAEVRTAGFGDADVAAPPSVHSHPPTQAGETIVPAEIISKPTPVYTEEARAKRIEGEVLLEVMLEATGRLRVLKVVRGLGYGLDDAAVRAAQQIRFKPALKDGQPLDSTAVVHIIFQLA
jgi:TonB family protein